MATGVLGNQPDVWCAGSVPAFPRIMRNRPAGGFIVGSSMPSEIVRHLSPEEQELAKKQQELAILQAEQTGWNAKFAEFAEFAAKAICSGDARSKVGVTAHFVFAVAATGFGGSRE